MLLSQKVKIRNATNVIQSLTHKALLSSTTSNGDCSIIIDSNWHIPNAREKKRDMSVKPALNKMKIQIQCDFNMCHLFMHPTTFQHQNPQNTGHTQK